MTTQSLREIVLDTETTGLDPADGHRIIEIGAIEVINRLPTGRRFHQYINPEREIDASAIRVHGITNEKIADMPFFHEVTDDLLAFMADSPLVAHNARFDINFLNHELTWASLPELGNDIVDTLAIAREKFPGAQVSLDALCRRYEIDLSERALHGALLDAELLATVYLELTGGQQPALMLADDDDDSPANKAKFKQTTPRPARNFAVPADELEAHKAFVKTIEDNLWGV